jgi:IS605 OrfB family transposase
MFKIIHGEIWSEDFGQLDQLTKDFSSCVRFCFARFQKDHSKHDDVRNLAKWQYKSLNVRQVSDAVLQAQSLYTRHGDIRIIFGSRYLWDKLKSKTITKTEWDRHRNGSFYARGDASRTGNNVARVVNDKLRVTVGHRKFVFYNLFIPTKFQSELQWLLASDQAYSVRLIKKDATHYRVAIGHQVEAPQTKNSFDSGAIGVDTNPDRIALCEVSKDGNYVGSSTLLGEKLPFASTDKRDYEIALLVKQVVDYSQKTGKGIVFENLNFNKTFDSNHKSNRMKSNFVYRKFLNLLERKCIEFGVRYRIVNPAFTSVIGKLKYKNIFQISTHEAAAFVIARRGLGYNEKLSLSGYSHKKVKETVLSTLRTHEGKYEEKRKKRAHSWSLWKCLRDNKKAVLTGLSSSMSSLKELDGLSSFDKLENVGENPTDKAFLLEQVVGGENSSVLQAKERLPSNLGFVPEEK